MAGTTRMTRMFPPSVDCRADANANAAVALKMVASQRANFPAASNWEQKVIRVMGISFARNTLSSIVRRFVVAAILGTLAVSQPAWADDDRASNTAIDAFFSNHCLACHDGDGSEADFDLSGLWNRFRSTKHPDEADQRSMTLALHRIEKGEMPPEDMDRPAADELEATAVAMRTRLIELERQAEAVSGRTRLRRLSAAEYANTLRDLLELPYLDSIDDMLPPDGIEAGFRKSSGALDFSHVTVAKFLDAADFALREAMADHATPIPPRTVRGAMQSIDGVSDTLQTLRVQLKQTTAIPLIGKERDPTLEVSRGDFKKREPGFVRDPEPKFDGVATFMHSRSNHNIRVKPFEVLQDGQYKIRIRGWGVYNDHGKLLPSESTETVAFYTPDGRLLGRCDVPPNEPTVSECRVWLRAGEPIEYLAVSIPIEQVRPKDKHFPRYETFAGRGLAIQWLELEGPLAGNAENTDNALNADASEIALNTETGKRAADAWPPASHRRLFGNLPLEPIAAPPMEDQPTAGKRGEAKRNAGKGRNQKAKQKADDRPVDPDSGLTYRIVSDAPEKDIRRLLRQFAAVAYRRPLAPGDIQLPVQLALTRSRQGQPFSEAMLAGYRAILTSPRVLLRLETPGPLDDHAIADRLAFFLWNGPPDRTLLRLAREGRMRDPRVRAEQVDRMMADVRFERFASHFLDDWLNLKDIRLTQPDDNLYPEYRPLIGESMLQETRAYFLAMVRDNLSIRSVYDSDFVMVNQCLAKLYDIKGVQGSAIRKVPIPKDHVRGGLLTQASILKVTANGTTTSPVVRGTFVMDRLLGDPPPPPPPSVPAIEPDVTGAVTIAEQLERHRADPSCAICHRKIDPAGFALESFDVMGGFRDRYRITSDGDGDAVDAMANGRPVQYQLGMPVECSGEMIGGDEFENIHEFRMLMDHRKRQIAENLLRRLIVYATGQSVRLADESVVADILDRTEKADHPIGDLIRSLIASPLFLHR